MFKWHNGQPVRFKKISTVILAILLAVLLYAIIHSFMPTVSANSESIYIEHTVEPGETIYSISRMYRDDQDWRKTAYEIQQASGCTALIRPGQVLLVPVHK